MDKLSKLQALLGENQVSTPGDTDASPWRHITANNIYEGTDSEADSEDDECIMRRGKISNLSNSRPVIAGASRKVSPNSREAAAIIEYHLALGDLAADGESFCPWLVVKRYPYSYVGEVNSQDIVERFFVQGKILDRPWDFFYIHRGSDSKLPAILLVPTQQFQVLLDEINQTLYTDLTIPSGGANQVFQITFANDGTPRPRYLGRSTTKDMAEDLRDAIPPNWLKSKNDPTAPEMPSDHSLEAFKAKIDLMTQAAKGKKVLNKEKQKAERVAKQQSWNHSTKRVQRYLGLRQASQEKAIAAAAQAHWDNSGSEWSVSRFVSQADIPRSVDFNPDKPALYDQEDDVVFVSIDLEANEKISSQITEIGIATLDTRDLKNLVPGDRGVNWHDKIRARHFRIEEYKHIVNSQYVRGCPGSFEFGKSEFVRLKNAPQAVASCFKPPFSNPDENAIIDGNEPKRKIILLGHGVGADIIYLRNIGYDVYNLSNLQELIDTSTMWQALKRDTNPRNLGSVLAELDIIGWNLHNAGNDAVYTLQAMIGIAIKQLHERKKRKEDAELEKKERVEEAIKEATQNALEREEGWSSGGDGSDGGAPVAAVPPGTRKPRIQQNRKDAQYAEEPWRAPESKSSNTALDQRNDGSWQRMTTSSSPPPSTSNVSWSDRNPSAKEAPRGGSTPTASIQSSNPNSRAIVDLVKKTTLFTISSNQPAPKQ